MMEVAGEKGDASFDTGGSPNNCKKNKLTYLPISNHNTRLMIVNFKRHFKEKCESSRSAD